MFVQNHVVIPVVSFIVFIDLDLLLLQKINVVLSVFWLKNGLSGDCGSIYDAAGIGVNS